MVDSPPRHRQDSSRDLLEELEDGWASSPTKAAAKKAAVAAATPAQAGAQALKTPLDPEAEIDVDALDDGWLDQLFPEDDEPDEPEEPEPDLPDEGVDPVAYAAAKKARDERARQKKDRKKS